MLGGSKKHVRLCCRIELSTSTIPTSASDRFSIQGSCWRIFQVIFQVLSNPPGDPCAGKGQTIAALTIFRFSPKKLHAGGPDFSIEKNMSITFVSKPCCGIWPYLTDACHKIQSWAHGSCEEKHADLGAAAGSALKGGPITLTAPRSPCILQMQVEKLGSPPWGNGWTGWRLSYEFLKSFLKPPVNWNQAKLRNHPRSCFFQIYKFWNHQPAKVQQTCWMPAELNKQGGAWEPKSKTTANKFE